jgi:serine/threonine-protein kinase RsbW
LVVEVADEGEGFDLDASLIDPTTPGNVDREDGRGLFLMRKLMDRVERIEAAHGSVVRMTLRRE